MLIVVVEVIFSLHAIRNGFRCVPADGVIVEDVLVATGEAVGHKNISSASRMNKAVVVFLKSQHLVNQIIESGLIVNEDLVQVTPLYTVSSKIMISNVPPFITNEALERELVCFGKCLSPFKMISLGCKHPALKHVMLFRRQVNMILDSPERTLDISFRVNHEGKTYMVYATTGSMKCFECGDTGHKRHACPHKERETEGSVSRTETDIIPASVPTQGVPDEIEAPPEVRVSEVRLPVLENTQISNEVNTTIAVNNMNKDIVESRNVENIDVHVLSRSSGSPSDAAIDIWSSGGVPRILLVRSF